MAQRARKGLATWLTSSTTPFFVLDYRKVVLVFNHGCEEITGWEAGSVIGKTCSQVTEGNPELVESVTGALCPPVRVLNGEPAVVPIVMSHRDGSSTPVEIHFFPLPQDDEDNEFRILGLLSPLSGSGIELVPESAVRRFELASLLSELHRKYATTSLIAKSPEMKRVAVQTTVASKNSIAVHLSGERGTGKEHVARIIHYGSEIQERRFIPLDCQSLSHFELSRTLRRLFAEDILESTAGTIYLKNIDSLARDLQAELLEHLNQGSPFRWMSSSLFGISHVDEEVFSRELAVELTPLVVSIPPLRIRGEDLLLLATQFLEEANRQQIQQLEGFSQEVVSEFSTYPWPGNVDELAEVVMQARSKCESVTIELEHLPVQFKAGRDAQSVRSISANEALETFLERVERSKILEALAAAKGKKSAAAEALQIPRAKLYRRMAALGIDDSELQAEATT